MGLLRPFKATKRFVEALLMTDIVLYLNLSKTILAFFLEVQLLLLLQGAFLYGAYRGCKYIKEKK